MGQRDSRQYRPAPVDPTLAKSLPHNAEAEHFILGAILLSPELVAEVAAYPVTEADFFLQSHCKVYAAMLRLAGREGVTIDPVVLADEMERVGELAAVGGRAFIASLYDGVPRFANLDQHCRVVTDASIRREVIHAANETLNEAIDGELTAPEQIEAAQSRMLRIEVRDAKANWQTVGDAAALYIAQMEEFAQSGRVYTGLATGFHDLDLMTGGLQRKDLIVVAGRPSMGKSAFAMGAAEGAALSEHNDKPAIAFFSAEMNTAQLIERMLSGRVGIDSFRLRTGRLAKEQWRRVADETDRLREVNIQVDDSTGLTPLKMRHKLRQFVREQKRIDLVIVDYFQAMRPSQELGKGATRDQVLATVSGDLKGIAKEFDVPLMALAAIGRDCEKEKDKRPRRNHLRECGALEFDLDVFLGLYRDEVYHPETEKQNIAEIGIGKQRMGPLGVVELRFEKQFTRFSNLFRDGGAHA